MRKLALLLTVFLLIIPVLAFSSNKPNEKLLFRIGSYVYKGEFSYKPVTGVEIYSPPIKGMKYHVLSPEGTVLFRGSSVLRTSEKDICGDKGMEDHWYILPPVGLVYEKDEFRPMIIVETPALIEFKPVFPVMVEEPAAPFIDYARKIAKKWQFKNTLMKECSSNLRM